MYQSETNWIVLARLLRSQGRRGEVLAELLTDFPERFGDSAEVHLARPTQVGGYVQLTPVKVDSHWLPQGRNQGRIVLAFNHIHTIEEAQAVAGFDVVVAEEGRADLPDGSFYIDDLIGCTVYDGEVEIGMVSDVQHITSADGKRRLIDTAPLLTVNLLPGEALIPFAKEFLVRLETAERKILMNLPQGLVDLNRVPIPKSETPAP